MPNFGMLPQTNTLLALATVTTSGSSAALTLPSASSYRILFQTNTVSGTLPTLVGGIATSFDGGATYNEVLSTSTISTAGIGQQLLIRPYLGIGDAATTQFTALLGTANVAAGLANNGPLNPALIKVFWVISGTTPSFAFQVQYAAVPQDLSD